MIVIHSAFSMQFCQFMNCIVVQVDCCVEQSRYTILLIALYLHNYNEFPSDRVLHFVVCLVHNCILYFKLVCSIY